MTLDLVTRVLTSLSNPGTFSSRWRETSDESLVAGWAGASIRFAFTGLFLAIQFGVETQRKDRWNGGTRMLDVSVYPFSPRQNHTLGAPSQTHTFDPSPEPGSSFVVPLVVTGEKCIVEISLIDWASVVEVTSLLVDKNAVIQPLVGTNVPPTILVIGDSISCGYTTGEEDGREPFPRGCLDAFPFQTQRILERDWGCKVDIELVAYPGASLVEPTDEERSKGVSFGMPDKFDHISPWDSQRWEGTCSPVAVAVALGTNDEIVDVSFDRFTEAVNKFTQKLVETFPSIREIWFITPFQDYNEAQGSVFRRSLLSTSSRNFTKDVPAGVEVCICDVQGEMKREMTIDGLHPNLEGQEILGRHFAEFVRARFQRMDLGDKV